MATVVASTALQSAQSHGFHSKSGPALNAANLATPHAGALTKATAVPSRQSQKKVGELKASQKMCSEVCSG